jgi:RHS repeat-associated protein
MTASNPSDATIFYTTDGSSPTHSGGTATGSTLTYTGPIDIGTCGDHLFKGIEYHAGYLDSDVNSQDFNHGSCGGGFGPMSASSTTIIFSVWDGDWAILEEYTSGNVLVEKYLQGYHGLVKTLVANIYYYQDELGSTSHIADGTGSIIESYQYDIYGKPRVYNASGAYQAGATPVAQDLFTGQRWRSELGLYDDRNRFMSPDLGRFLQPDPIGFKGDASNLYRYCGNDWANRTDPMGLEFNDQGQTFGQYAPPEAYGYTQPKMELVGVSFTRDDGGVQAHVKDFNLSVKSVVWLKIQCVQNGKVVWLDRDPKNVDRTSKHEGDHREHNRQWYNQNHDKFLKELNNGERFKDEKSAEKATKEKLEKAFQDFNKKEHDHLPPNWNNYKQVDECAQQRQTPQAAQVEPNAEQHDTKSYGSHDYIQGIGSTADLKPN